MTKLQLKQKRLLRQIEYEELRLIHLHEQLNELVDVMIRLGETKHVNCDSITRSRNVRKQIIGASDTSPW